MQQSQRLTLNLWVYETHRLTLDSHILKLSKANPFIPRRLFVIVNITLRKALNYESNLTIDIAS